MKEISSKWVNPLMLRRMRERLGFSPSEVEKLSKKCKFYAPIEAKELEKWEQGVAEPDLEHLETLAEIYVCPVGYFFLKEPPKEDLPLSTRGIATEKKDKLSPSTKQTLRKFVELAKWTVYLVKETGLDWTVKIQPTECSDVRVLVNREKERLGFSPEIREKWNLPEDAFMWWRRTIENMGVFCFELKLDVGDIRGASMWVEKIPFILVNHQDVEAATGRTFTLLHEYAHLITSTEGLICDFRGVRSKKENPEPFANQFAARMLLTHEELKRRLQKMGKYFYKETWSDKLLDEIREPFFVSRDVIAIMLQEMGLAPDNFYEKKRTIWDKRKPYGKGGKRPTKNERKFREIGFSLANILLHPKVKETVSIVDLSYILDMKVEKTEEFISWLKDIRHHELDANSLRM